MLRGGPIEGVPELQAPGAKLLRVVEAWLRTEKVERRRRLASAADAPPAAPVVQQKRPMMPSKQMAYFR